MKKIIVASCLYNEEKILPYFLRHYLQVVESPKEIHLWVDPQTTDRTVEIAHDMGCSIYESPVEGLDDFNLAAFPTHHLKKMIDQAEWVIWPDGDELIYPVQGLITRLDQHKAQGQPLIKPGHGWQMSCDHFPTTTGQIYEEVRKGRLEEPVSKPIIVQPSFSFHWGVGKHSVDRPNMITVDTDLNMLHFRFLGLPYFLDRNHSNWDRIDTPNRVARHGWQTAPEQDEFNTTSYNIRIKEDQELLLW